MKSATFNNFETLEKRFLSAMRERINNAEDRIDLENHFSRTVKNFLMEATDNSFKITEDDILFSPDHENYYEISDKLKSSKEFIQTWENSNLPNFLKKVADSTYHKYIHLGKHLEKTERKIRN